MAETMWSLQLFAMKTKGRFSSASVDLGSAHPARQRLFGACTAAPCFAVSDRVLACVSPLQRKVPLQRSLHCSGAALKFGAAVFEVLEAGGQNKLLRVD
eukprot:CAMPEP_0171165588 /NCGR_PEP_ID=MMETSP0790-20130122/6262_1 /TAXON_ID=2925 /ORGANISM="Alexandrium catenella, Strain OF101" /LENGTH=98 /DNA_ID=CAMNT_0011630381 /DNA_START=60 /DNA_END=356 /DNA_ORIENTATION=-